MTEEVESRFTGEYEYIGHEELTEYDKKLLRGIKVKYRNIAEMLE